MKRTSSLSRALALTLLALGVASSTMAASTPTSTAKANTNSANVQATPVAIKATAPVTTTTGTDTTTLAKPDASQFTNLRQYLFSDVPANYWAATAISQMAQDKIINGYSDGTFKPEKPITREEAAIIFNNLTDKNPGVMLASNFSDITSDRWSALAIQSVAEKNIISGYGDGNYKPDQLMSRQEFAVVADNYLHYLGYTTEDPTELDTVAYSDQKFVANWAQNSVRELAHLGFLNYNPKTLFNPEKYITRAEAAEITYRMTSTPQAVEFKKALIRQQTESQAIALIDKTMGYNKDFSKFRQVGAMYWTNNKLHIGVKDAKARQQLTDAFAKSASGQLQQLAEVATSKYTQEGFDTLQQKGTDAYAKIAPNGKIISVTPDETGSKLIFGVDTLNENIAKAFKKQVGTTIELVQPQDNTITWVRPISYELDRHLDANK